jgi:hypothetical protein
LTWRDETTHDEILAIVRELLAHTPGVSFGQLVFSAAKFAVPGSDVLNIPDRAMLRALRARCYRNRLRPMVDGTVSIEHLAALDEVDDEDTAPALEWLRDQLVMIRGWLDRSGAVDIADGTGRLASPSAFEAWCRVRYPRAAEWLLGEQRRAEPLDGVQSQEEKIPPQASS